jgi:hypothetical protein
VYYGHAASAEFERESVGQLEPVVGIPGDRVNLRVWGAVAQGRED